MRSAPLRRRQRRLNPVRGAMTLGFAVVDGVVGPLSDACIPVTDLGLLMGWTVFETLSTDSKGQPRRLAHHLRRLAASAQQAHIACPSSEQVEREIAEAVERLGGAARVRITLTGSGRRVIVASPLDPSRRHRPIRAVCSTHFGHRVLPGSVKHGSRAESMVEVRASGVDEVLWVDGSGRFTEGTTSAVLAVVDGAVVTAPHDGSILPSVTVVDLLERATRLGLAVRREAPLAAGPWTALYIASSLRDIAPVIELDGKPLPGWDPVGRMLADTR